MIVFRRSATNVKQSLTMSTLSMSTSTPALPTNSLDSGKGSAASCSGGGGIQNHQFNWDNVFTPENKLKTIELLTMDRENLGSTIFQQKENVRRAAVLIPLCCDMNGSPSLLYNLRSLRMKSHKGEISFPGGAIDPEDDGDPITAALRETNEELGIERNTIEIWTTLRSFSTISSDKYVVPILGFIDGRFDPNILKVNPDEVEHAFTVTLEHLCNPANWVEGPKRKLKGRNIRLPAWKNLNVYNGIEEVRLWGLTAFITHIVLLALLPEKVYTRNVPYLNLQFNSTISHEEEKPESKL